MVNYCSLKLRDQLGRWSPSVRNPEDPLSQGVVVTRHEELVQATDKVLYLQGKGKLEVLGTFSIWGQFRDWALDRQVTNFWTNQRDQGQLKQEGDYVPLSGYEGFKSSLFYLIKGDVPFTMGQEGLRDFDLCIEYPKGSRLNQLRSTWVLRRDPMNLIWTLKGRNEILHDSEIVEGRNSDVEDSE
jgi:hypothetical protein